MTIVKSLNRMRWVAKIVFLVLFISEKLDCFESLETDEITFLKYLKTIFLVTFIIASILENRLIVKEKDKEIETLKARLNETSHNKSLDVD